MRALSVPGGSPSGLRTSSVSGIAEAWSNRLGLASFSTRTSDDVRPRPGDGLQEPLGDELAESRTRELRGGSFLSTFVKSRSTFRFYQTMEGANFVFGVRPSRPLSPAPLR